MPFIRADQIDTCLPGAHIRINLTVYVRMQDSQHSHVDGHLFDPKTGWWGHWSRLVESGDDRVLLMTWSPEQALLNQVHRMQINMQSSGFPERESAVTALRSALPIIDAYRRLSGGDGDACAMNIRDVLRKMSPVR